MQLLNNIVIDTSEQGSEEWRTKRLGHFTASEAGSLMMKQKNGKPYATRQNYITQLALERITGELPEQTGSPEMQEGKERERTAALAYSFRTGNETEQTGFWHNDILGASPDDLIVGQNGGVEYKNPKPATHYQTLINQSIPEHYYWQILQCLLVTKKDFWDYVSYHPAFSYNAQLFIKRIEAEQVKDDIQSLHDELVKANDEVEKQVQFIKNYKEDA